jgi:hypothetical protein
MTLVKLVNAITTNGLSHSYTLKIHGSDGLIRTRTLKINDCDAQYGKLRMSSARWAMRDANYGKYIHIAEETYELKLNSWLAKR